MSSNMDQWNPFEKAFTDSDFNSYNKGPGKNLPKENYNRGVQLYITGIPINLTEEALQNLFLQSGKVMRIKIMKSKIEGANDTFGFVTMGSLKEATDAISRFNNFQVDRFRLRVQACRSPEERARLRRKREEENAFLSTLNCSRNPVIDENDEDIQFQKQKMNGLKSSPQKPVEKLEIEIPSVSLSDLDESIIQHGPPSLNVVSSSEGSVSDLKITVGNKQRQVKKPLFPNLAGGMSIGRGQNKFVEKGQVGNTRRPDNTCGDARSISQKSVYRDPRSVNTRIGKQCLYCKQPASSLCTRCKMPYCGKECQTADWPKHKNSCSKISSMPKELEDDFEVSIGEDIYDYLSQDDGEAIKKQFGDKLKLSYTNTKDTYHNFKSLNPISTSLKSQELVLPRQKSPIHSSPVPDKCLQSKVQRLNSTVQTHMYGDLPQRQLNLDTEILTMVTFIESPDRFWVGLATEIGKAVIWNVELSTTLEACIQARPKTDQLFFCKFKDMWCRARVLAPVGGDLVKITYIDFGNKETVTFGRLFPLPKVLTSTYPLAVQCKLSGVCSGDKSKGWPTNCLSTYLQLNMQCTIKATKKDDNVYLVTAKNSEGEDVGEQLVKAKIAEIICSKIFVKDIQTALETLFPEKEVQLFVVLANSPEDFIVQIDEPTHTSTLAAFTTELDKMCEKKPRKVYRPDIGELVSCKYKDDHWYRGEVLRVTNAAANVYFLDYGDVSEIILSNIQPITREQSDFPAQAIKCCLYGIKEVRSINEIIIDEKFSEFCLSLGCKYKSKIKKVHGNIASIELYDKKNRNVLDILKEYVLKKTANPIQHTITNVKLPFNENVSCVFATFLKNSFFCVTKIDSYAKLAELVQEINQDCTSTSDADVCRPSIGDYVCASFEEIWYRAKVLKVDGDAITVNFVDYGNTERVSIKEITWHCLPKP